MSNIDKRALREELSNPAIGSNAHLRKLALALLDELETKEEQRANWFQMAQKLGEDLDAAEKRIADYHRALNNLASVARRYLPDYDEHPDIQAADDLLENAATHQGSQLVSNRDELPEEKGASLQLRNLIRRRHAEWSDATFGNVGPVGSLKHLSKEALEAAAEPDDLSEWADMQFLLWDAQRRAGISDGEITAAMEEKLKVNMARQWPEPKDGEPRLHIKEQSESVLPEIECDICGNVSIDPEGRHHCCEDNSND